MSSLQIAGPMNQVTGWLRVIDRGTADSWLESCQFLSLSAYLSVAGDWRILGSSLLVVGVAHRTLRMVTTMLAWCLVFPHGHPVLGCGNGRA
ncbi:hypothetical protein BHQ17_17770 [Mycolicibacterium holsaticum]|uniref:Uncharacterized protein n=1 Tax=Mycolicibacterium holsaticum TaxID=152142 RepID=A0A1E3RIL5_9MYCO|nr:hypothetical protein BHQ17_17770 [Mycolicibacterium holsaticum]